MMCESGNAPPNEAERVAKHVYRMLRELAQQRQMQPRDAGLGYNPHQQQKAGTVTNVTTRA